MNTTAQLSVNPENLLKTLRSAFDGKRSVIRELGQNARRAGATWIRFTLNAEANSLTVVDNGCGISDMNALLSVAQSGWSDEIKEVESPYGLGALAALYTASQIEVASAGVYLFADTADILSFNPVDLCSVNDDGVTTITLRGPEVGQVIADMGDKREKVFKTMSALFRGFPIPVFVNDQEVDRSHALDNGAPWRREEGMIWQRYGISDETLCFQEHWVAYYQGFCIADSLSGLAFRSAASVIHLDSQRWHAIAPDRHKLVDESLAVRRINLLFKNEQSRILDCIVQREGEFASMATEQILLNSYEAVKSVQRLDIYNAMDAVPGCVLKRYQALPEAKGNIRDDDLDEVLVSPADHIHKRAVERGDIALFKRSGLPNYSDSFAGAMYLWLTEGYWLEGDLDDQHWLHPMLLTLSDVSVELNGVRQPSIPVDTYLSGENLDVSLCESYTLNGPVGAISCDEHAFMHVTKSTDNQSPYRTLVIPSRESSSQCLTQALIFLDFNEEPNEFAEQQYRVRFVSWLQTERLGGDPLALLKMVLAKAIADFPPLKGNVIRAELGESGNVDIELLNLTSE